MRAAVGRASHNVLRPMRETAAHQDRIDARETTMNIIDFELRGEFIALDSLLKATGVVGSGGAAKALVADGQVAVDGEPELRKTCKVRAGQEVAVTGVRVRGHAPTMPASLD